MSSKYSIETIFRAIDQFSDPTKRMQAVGKIFAGSLKSDFAKAQRSFDRFTEGFKKRLGQGIMIGTGLAIAGITKFVWDSNKAWDQQIEALKSVEATLKSTGGTVNRTLKQLEDQSTSLQEKTFFGDDTILQHVTAQMLTFTNITGNTFDRAQKSVLDVTAKLKGLGATGDDLQGTTIQLSKALNDPVANLGALSRSGIQFSKQQKDLIKNLVQSGKLWKAQDIILTEIEKQYGGTAEALTKTTKGLALQNANLINNIQESIGKAIEPLRLKILQFINTALKKIDVEKLAANIEKGATALWNFGKGLFTVLSFIKPLLPIILGLIIAFKTYQIVMMIAVAAQWAMNIALTANPIGIIVVGIGLLIAAVIYMIIYWKQIVAWLKIGWDWLVKTYNSFKGLSIILGGLVLPIVIIIELVQSLIQHWGYITEAFKSKGILGGLFAIGKVILSALLSPIESLFNLLGKIPGVGKMFKEWGMNIGEFKSGMFEEGQAPISPAEKSSYTKNETVSKGELTIKDKTGTAQMTKKPNVNNYNLKLQSSGAF